MKRYGNTYVLHQGHPRKVYNHVTKSKTITIVGIIFLFKMCIIHIIFNIHIFYPEEYGTYIKTYLLSYLIDIL